MFECQRAFCEETNYLVDKAYVGREDGSGGGGTGAQ